MDVSGKDITALEISYEVCNKVGGIYTVITSKMPRMLEHFKGYIAVGPYYEKPASLEFEDEKPPLKFQKAFNSLNRKYGINCFYGRWIIQEQRLHKKKPLTILIDPAGYRAKTNDIKRELWETAGVDSINSTPHFDEPLPWARSTGLLIEELLKSGVLGRKVVCHFHEWLSGAGMLYLRSKKLPVKTVFLTHSTALGRTIALSGKEDIYSIMKSGLSEGRAVSDDKAREYNAMDRHTMERASAHNADIFAAVSEILGRECEFILGKKPDVILHNGLDLTKFPVMEDLSDLHITYRNHIRRFLAGYFSPYHAIDVNDNLLFFVSGRFEFRNKGIDLLLDALGRLNKRLKAGNSKKNVVVFIWVPCYVRERRHDVMDNLALFEDLEEAITEESERISERILDAFSQRRPVRQSRIMDEDFLHQLKVTGIKIRKKGENPPISPFVMDSNEVTSGLERNALMNSPEDRVKVVYYPRYLSSTDGILGLNYYDAMIGCHVGIFPSYYESWGYTPLEAAALGCQSITSDLAGYGRFIKPQLGKDDYSIMVVPRKDKKYEDSVAYLEDILFRIYRMDKRQRVQFKIRAKQLSKLADWGKLIKNYIKAYEMALAK